MTDRWPCHHCHKEIRGPVAAHLGQRACAWHPGTITLENGLTCCGRSHLSRPCTPCDHLPTPVFTASHHGQALWVPRYILHPHRTYPPGDPALDPDEKLRATMTRCAHRERRYQETLDPARWVEVQLRAQEDMSTLDMEKKQRSLSWVPRPPPLSTNATVEKKEEENIAANMLTVPHDEALATRPAHRTLTAYENAVVHHLREEPVEWIVLKVTN